MKAFPFLLSFHFKNTVFWSTTAAILFFFRSRELEPLSTVPHHRVDLPWGWVDHLIHHKSGKVTQHSWAFTLALYLVKMAVYVPSEEEKVKFMSRAIELSDEGASKGFGGPFGSVIVKDGKIYSWSVSKWHRKRRWAPGCNLYMRRGCNGIYSDIYAGYPEGSPC